MTFLHPFMLFATFAVAMPFVIHWLTRPRPRRFPLSTVRFVMEAVHQRRARHRLRDWIILLLRGLAVALLAWAFARPLFGTKPLIAAGAGGQAVRVVIVDQSQSMSAVSRGITPFERARTIASQHLAYEPGVQANLILAGARPRVVFEHVSGNFGALRDELSRAQPRPERLELQEAINTAARMLAPSNDDDQRRRELVIVSDFQRANWSGADFTPLSKDTRIQFESVAPAQTPANLAIARVGAQGRMELGRAVRLEVDVANYSPTPRDVQVELTLGQQSFRLGGMCPPNVKTTLTTDVLLRERGSLAGEARLLGIDDALAADNARAFVLDVRPMPLYALLSREPAKPRPTSSHFLERALAPIKAREGQESVERVVRIDPAQLDREAIAGASVIVLDHPGKISPQSIELLAAMVRRGRGLLYFAAEPVDATNLSLFADAVGTEMKMPVAFAPASAGQPRKDLFLTEWRAAEPPFKTFGESISAALGSLRFSGGLATRKTENGLLDDILASYSDRSACLVVTPCGAGAVAVMNADLSQSNLPASSVFVPLVGELVGRLLAQRGAPEASACGEPLALYLPADAGDVAGLTLSGPPEAGEDLGNLTEESNFVMWRWNIAGPPGVYRAMRNAAPVFAFATAAPALESELSTIDPSVLTTRLTGGRNVYFRGGASDQPEQKDDAWAWILAACTACLIGELAALKIFRT